MISLLIVNYRSAALALEAIRTARSSTSDRVHVVVVDNTCEPEEAERLRPHADVLLVSATNRGYAGAINDGRRHCEGDIVIVANPDVVFFPEAIDRLADALRASRRAVAGPALFWDSARQWILPPADARTAREKVSEALASRSRSWQLRRDRRRTRERLAFWSLTAITSVPAISGAVMAIRLRDFDAVQGFDERFPLYFEESDFLRRIAQSGKQIVYVPSSHVRHIYNQSAAETADRAAALYGSSERTYWSKWYGRVIASALLSLDRGLPAIEFARCAETFDVPREGLLVEASPLPGFATAAGHRAGSTSVRIPDDVWQRYRAPALYLRAVDPDTAEAVAACVRYRS